MLLQPQLLRHVASLRPLRLPQRLPRQHAGWWGRARRETTMTRRTPESQATKGRLERVPLLQLLLRFALTNYPLC